MVKTSEKNIVMKSEFGKGMRIFEIAMGAIAFCALYFTLVSALPLNALRYVAVLPGIAVALVFLIFGRKKLIMGILLGVVALYTILCASASVSVFTNGALSWWNGIADSINQNTHSGLGYALSVTSNDACYVFSSVLSVWLALGVAALCRRLKAFLIIIEIAVLIILFLVGLYPSVIAVVLMILSLVGLMIVGNGLSIKSALSCTLCVAVLTGAIVPCVVYNGSDAVKDFRNSIVSNYEDLTYGTDALPEGKLMDAAKMQVSNTPRLNVTLSSHTPVLYLKGFVGSELTNNVWQPTDKNLYVQDGYQGLIEWLKSEGFPTLQYADYAKLSGEMNKYNVTVENVGGRRKYIYTPYSINSYSSGEQNYDLNLRGKDKEYSYVVFSSDESSERTTQASWLFDDANRTVEMEKYLQLEEEYRSFVYYAYSNIDKSAADLISKTVGDSDATSINTVAQIIRATFLDKYRYSKSPDDISDDFISDFFGGKIIHANSAYFATAATYIFRLYGFAARYVEGYLVTTDEAVDIAEHTVEVTDQNAHAWTEVYFDGIGWLPIEVTPTYFLEENPDTTVDPDNSDSVDEQPADTNVERPSEETTEPDAPTVPPKNEKPKEPKPEPVNELLETLKILVPILGAVLGALLIVLALILRREIILKRKRKMLECNGEELGRAAYVILQRECKCIGGIDTAKLEEYGIASEKTDRFMQLVERSVYGAYELNLNERKYVEYYLESVASAIISSGGRVNKLVKKYIRCLGL